MQASPISFASRGKRREAKEIGDVCTRAGRGVNIELKRGQDHMAYDCKWYPRVKSLA